MGKMMYQWNQRGEMKFRGADAQSVGERLEFIRSRNGETINKDVVVSDASDAASPLHPLFEWDDSKAAIEYRREQAHYLIRSVDVTVERSHQESAPIRAFVSLKQNGTTDGTYESISVVANDPVKREQLLKNALGELNQWRRRYSDLQEFMKLFTYIDQLIVKISENHELRV